MSFLFGHFEFTAGN